MDIPAERRQEFDADLQALGEAVGEFNFRFIRFQEKHGDIARARGYVRSVGDFEPDKLIVTVDAFFAQFGNEKE